MNETELANEASLHRVMGYPGDAMFFPLDMAAPLFIATFTLENIPVWERDGLTDQFAHWAGLDVLGNYSASAPAIARIARMLPATTIAHLHAILERDRAHADTMLPIEPDTSRPM